MKRLVVLATTIVALAVPSAGLAAGFPPGAYTAQITAPAPLKGTWVLDFAKGGTYTITDNGSVVVRGHFTSTSRLYLSKERGPLSCPQYGVYAWKRAGKALTFRKVSDPCTGRASVLAHPFTVKA